MTSRLLRLALLAALALAPACARRPGAAPTATGGAATGPAVAATATPAAQAALSATAALTGTAAAQTAARPTPAPPQPLTVTASGGTALAASYYPPVIARPVAGQKSPAVLLLHMVGGSRHDWDLFAAALQSNGMAALALDLRGHGDSPGPADWDKSPADVRSAWDALVARPDVDPARTAIVGASIGANLALIVGANNADVATVAALSPGLDFHGLKPAGLLGNFGQRPVLLIASRDDAYSYDSAQQMALLLAAPETFFYTNAGHGTAMFSNPDLELRLVTWLLKYIGEPKG
jgi:dienelactone hydrolase